MNIVFASYAASKDDLLNNYLLASGIHDFAGNLSDIPLRVYVPSNLDIKDITGKFADLNAGFSSFPAVREDVAYAFKPAAARACEADTREGCVIWLDRHMLVLNPCVNLLLNPQENFAFRPPHLKLLGAPADAPVNQLWAALYKIAGINADGLFSMYTEVDRQKIRPYFSAGHFSFRAEKGIMRQWDELFNQLADHRDIKPFLGDESQPGDGETVSIFLHQMALTLTVLKTQSRDSLKPLPGFYGYPSHLHNDMEKYCRASLMDQLHTVFYSCRDGMPGMPLSAPLASWIEDKIRLFRRD